MNEKELDYLESQIPELAESAVKIAYLDTLSRGKSVLESINGKIYRVFPNGSKELVKEVEPDIKCSSKKIYIK